MTRRLMPWALLLLVLILGCRGAGEVQEAPAYEAVSFTTGDGVKLSGRLFGQGKVFVILAHMFPADQGSWTSFAQRLAQEGYAALTFDFRGYGDSQGKKEINKIDRDLASALAFVRGRGAERVFLIGASMGGTASLKIAAREGVAGVVSLSAPREFRGLSAREEIGQIKAPLLFIASRGDRSAFDSAQFFYERASAPRDKLIIEGSAHGTNILQGEKGAEVEEAILAFLERYR